MVNQRFAEYISKSFNDFLIKRDQNFSPIAMQKKEINLR